MSGHGQGQRVGYVRVSSVGQNTERQLSGVQLDRVFEDKCSGKDTRRPQLEGLLKHVRPGDTVMCHSIDRFARSVEDLRKLVTGLTERGVRVEFVKEGLVFTSERNPISELMLGLLGSIAQFERAIILERQREGIALAKVAGRYRGGIAKLKPEQVEALRKRVCGDGCPIARAAREFGLSRQSVYTYLKPHLEARTAA